ncbi:MAG: zosA [Candidatus Saccharibacteria bacterium]|nr:zosA [Candidatus Saccharibacteria bacterium]
MLRKIWRFFKEYRQLGFVILASIAGLILDLSRRHTAAHWVLGVSALIAAVPLIWGMFEDLRSGKYGIDILAATAIIASVALHEYWAGMVVVLMLTGGEALEDYAEGRAKVELSALIERSPKLAHVIRKGKTIDVPVDAVHAKDVLVIKPGEVVPVDCVITDGSANIDESSITGESLPVEKKPGDELLSGSVNTDGALTVRALRSARESQFEQIVKLVRAATSSQSPFVRLADRYSIPFTIISFAIAGVTWALTGQAIRFLEVIVVATPCPLLLGAPIALVSGISRAARHGIIVKNGTAIERLGEVKTIGFDKTGTLTKGQPVVDEVIRYGQMSQKDIIALAAAVEQHTNHILARAIMEKAAQLKIKPIKTKQFRELAGNGLEATVKGQTVLVGKAALLAERGIAMPAIAKKAAKQTTAYVAVDGKVVGAISFKDELRPESKKTLGRLRRLGIKHLLMVTGDNRATAETIAKQLGLTDVYADALPGDKLRIVESVPDKPVAFVGDGINDAPVLAASDVGIALGARGSSVASETADVVIMQDNLSRVADSVAIAKRTFFIARQSILIGIFISIGLMFIFSTGKFKPVYGAAIQELVDVTVIFNALRAHGPFRRGQPDKLLA